jgi:hypothetical protein
VLDVAPISKAQDKPEGNNLEATYIVSSANKNPLLSSDKDCLSEIKR